MSATARGLTLKPEAVHELHHLAGTASKVDLATTIGADPAEFAMVATGRTSPSLALVARIIVAFPQMSLSSLCAVT
jgi:hypothetical protein